MARNKQKALELCNINQSFGALRAIDNISLSVAQGQRYAIIGSNGAGKTTLFNAITGDFQLTSGKIFLFGKDITSMPSYKRIRRGLRRTYQSSMLFNDLTVWDNIFLAVQGVKKGRFGMRRLSKSHSLVKMTYELLTRYNLMEIEKKLVCELSHGQQRQVEIAMAMAGEPALILFDEPAAGLSAIERSELLKSLSKIPASIGFIIIEHDLEIALSVADQVTVMHNGSILCDGTPEEIQNNELVNEIYMGKNYAY